MSSGSSPYPAGMKDTAILDLNHCRRASEVIGLTVWHAYERVGQVTGLVYDTVSLLFCVQVQPEQHDTFLVIPVRSLHWHDPQQLSLKDQTTPQPLTEQHLPARGLPVRVGRKAKMAFVYDLFIDPQASRIAAFQLTALPGVQQDAHTVQVSGEEVERWAGELQISNEVLAQLTHSLHTPVRVG